MALLLVRPEFFSGSFLTALVVYLTISTFTSLSAVQNVSNYIHFHSRPEKMKRVVWNLEAERKCEYIEVVAFLVVVF